MELRRKAEQRLLAEVLDAEASEIDADELAHELRLYQVELELQNEQLRITTRDVEQNRDRYRELIESSPIALVVLDERGSIEEANGRACSILGTAELEGRPLAAWLRAADADCAHVQLRSLFETGKAQRTEAVVRKSSGGEAPVVLEWSLARRLQPKRCIAAIIDVGVADPFRQIVDNLEDLFLVVELSTKRPLFISSACEKVLGRPATEILTDPIGCSKWIHEDDRRRVTLSLEGFVRGDPLDIEYRMLRPDGEIRMMHTRAYRVGSEDRAAAVTIDVTDERRLEDELARAQKMEAIGELASGIAHDFNNLLMGVAGFAALALRRLESEHPAHPIVNRIAEVVSRGKTLTRHLLDFSRKRRRERTTVDLDAAVASCGPLLATFVGEHIEVAVRTEAFGCRVVADAGEIEQILMNLAANARDAMTNGGTLEVSTHETTLKSDDQALRKGRHAALIVRDTGCGMDESTMARAFEPFFTTKAPGSGTGLGLSNISSMVKRMGGHITVQSRIGYGTTVTILLPVLPETSDLELLPEIARTHGIVLVVEDDPLVRTTVAHYLENLGFRALPACGVWEAKRFAKEYAGQIETLLTDVILPHQLGKELAQELTEEIPGLHVIYMSAHERDYLLEQSRIDVESRLLQKPFDERTLGLMLHRVLDA